MQKGRKEDDKGRKRRKSELLEEGKAGGRGRGQERGVAAGEVAKEEAEQGEGGENPMRKQNQSLSLLKALIDVRGIK